jgi:hypothetical protein
MKLLFIAKVIRLNTPPWSGADVRVPKCPFVAGQEGIS